MTFLDTGKSDCIVIELEDCVIVNDTADADDYELISDFLDEKQITTIDYMILSHFDKDHIGSAAMLLTNYDVNCVIMPDYEETSLYYEALVQALEQSDAQQLLLYDDYSFTASGAEIVVSAANETEYKDDNNYSLITTVTYGENRFLLMGDAMKKRTGEFLETVLAEEHYDLIKMPHHGDYYKKLEDLIACVRPDAAVLTVGQERDRLEEETVLLLQEYGCRIYDTIDGNVNVESDGANISVTQG
ncbi:MAG: MBL fold metallo-hydrolase [Lachnospiraceae bacterium]|nr:MBL fold metallo-hydrolase [Lachnospiraceae bacterium]